MGMPVIGITTASLTALEGVAAPQPESWVVGRRYVEAVVQAGAVPWPVPTLPDAAFLEAIYGRLDGLLLTGGSDIRPAQYGGALHPRVDRGDAPRDDAERLLASWARRDALPLLGICRGMQMLNVSRGGTLVPDLPTAERGVLKHDYLVLARHPRDLRAHPVDVVPGTRLAGFLDTGTVAVNSLHHQAVDGVGEGLVVCATAPDGVVEGVEDPSLPFCVGVQWHPEELVARDPAMGRLFRALVSAASDRASGGSSAPVLAVAG